MKLIVGLGNPGARYAKTRHNFGRLMVEFAAEETGAKFVLRKPLKASVCPLSWGREDVLLAYPEQYVNESGEAVANLVAHLGIDSRRDLLVILDDLALPFGKLRLRAQGSDGGHNGLKSIHASLGGAAYPRLRCGIGHPREIPGNTEEVRRYVLAPFNREEFQELQGLLETGLKVCRLWAETSIEKAANALTQAKS